MNTTIPTSNIIFVNVFYLLVYIYIHVKLGKFPNDVYCILNFCMDVERLKDKLTLCIEDDLPVSTD